MEVNDKDTILLFRMIKDKLLCYNNNQYYVISTDFIIDSDLKHLSTLGIVCNSILIDFDILNSVLYKIKNKILGSLKNINKNTKQEISKLIKKERNRLLLSMKAKKYKNPYPIMFIFMEYNCLEYQDRNNIVKNISPIIKNIYAEAINNQLNSTKINLYKYNINIPEAFKIKKINKNPVILIGIK